MFSTFFFQNYQAQDVQDLTAPRVPKEKDGNFLLLRNDTVILSYYWAEMYHPDNYDFNSHYKYHLVLSIKNLLPDTISVQYRAVTYEKTKKDFYSLAPNGEYGFVPADPFFEIIPGHWANSHNIVEFEFEIFLIKIGKRTVIDVTKQVLEGKRNRMIFNQNSRK